MSGGSSSSYHLRPVSDDDRVHKLRRVYTDVSRHVDQLNAVCMERRQDYENARDNLNHVIEKKERALEKLREAEEEEAEKERKIRHEKFLEDVDSLCFLCRDKFSASTGTPSFSVVSYKCDCSGNARMVHLGCWVSFPPGQEKCGLCKSVASLIDSRGNKFKVSVEMEEVLDVLSSDAASDSD